MCIRDRSISCDSFKNKWRILARFARSKGSYAGCQIIGFLGVSGDSVKIADITAENKTVNFIARIVSAFEIKEFTRDDGTIGRVGNLIVGDETGKIRVTLWDNIADLIKTMKSDLLKFIRASLLR